MNAFLQTDLGAQTTEGYGPNRRWEAEIKLEFSSRPDKTVMEDMWFKGPMRVQRPFFPEGKACHVYLLHPPGGMVSGDRIDISVCCNEGSHALLTTPSAGKVYRADSQQVVQSQHVCIELEQAICEWLPQETILFNGANAHLSTRVDLRGNSLFTGWDMVSLGRKAGDEPFCSGALSQQFSINLDGLPLNIENFSLDKELVALSSPVGLHNFTQIGTLYWAGENIDAKADALKRVLEKYAPAPDEAQFYVATHKPNILMVRGFEHDAENLRNTFIRLWSEMREEVLDIAPCPPRIWST